MNTMSCPAMPATGPTIQVGIVDRHPLFRSALCEQIKGQLPGVSLSELGVSTVLAAAQTATPLPPLLLLDLQAPGLGAMTGLLQLAIRHPATRIIAVCDDLPDEPQQLLMHGAMAVIPKSASAHEFIAAIHAVLQGLCWLPVHALERPFCDLQARTGPTAHFARLSPRRQLIVDMIADGLLNKQIAHELGLCESTIKAHVSQIMKILRVRNRTQIAAMASRMHHPSTMPPGQAACDMPMPPRRAHPQAEHKQLL